VSTKADTYVYILTIFTFWLYSDVKTLIAYTNAFPVFIRVCMFLKGIFLLNHQFLILWDGNFKL